MSDLSSERSTEDGPLRNYWHPVAWSSELGVGPKLSQLLGEQLVLWRPGPGTVRAALDRCPHRGTSLSLGTIDTETNIVCPYHGWTYDETGTCRHIAQLATEARIPSRARLSMFACEERFGIIWVCLGEAAAPIPQFPEWEDPTYRHVACEAYTWKTSAARMVENFTDFGHLGYLHDGLLGSRDDLVVPPHHVEDLGKELRYSVTMAVPNTNDRYSVTDVTSDRGLQTNSYVLSIPFTIHLRCRYHDTGAYRTLFFAAQPRSATESTGYCYQSRDFDLEADGGDFASFQALLAEQDRPIVESQRPVELPLELTSELHLPFDRVAVAYRRALARLVHADANHIGAIQTDAAASPTSEGERLACL